jgi:hypothetical protein
MKIIESFPNYRISCEGAIESIKTGKKIKSRLDKDGYCVVNLYRDFKMKTVKVHRLVAAAYRKNTNNLPLVNHKNGIKSDNHINNLEWCTNGDNMKHAYKNGLIEKCFGEDHSHPKITNEIVYKIRSSNKTGRDLAREFNISESNVSLIKNKKAWTHI